MIEGRRAVRGVALDKQQARLSLIGVPDEPGIAYKIFCQLAQKGISVDLIIQCVSQDQQTEVDLTVKREDAKKSQS